MHTKKIVGGLGWVALSQYANRLFGFVTTLILAKLLVPEDFGLVAVAVMLVDVLKLFRDMGLGQALIHRRDDIEAASHTAFFLLISVNVVLYLGAIMLAPTAAEFYQNPAVTMVLIVISSNLVWFSMRAVPDALVRKSIDFKKLVVPELVPAILGSVIAISMAYNGFGVWSLVVKSLVSDMLGTALIWRYTEFRPALRFNWKIAREMMHYGKYIIGNSIFLVVVYNVDRFYLSKYGGLALLGLYTVAFTIANLPTTEVGHIICRVMFPVFSRLNNDIARLRVIFLKTIRYASLLVLPVSFGIAVYGPPLVNIVYGDKWAGMTVALQLLCIYALSRSLSAIMHELYKATGQPYLAQRFTIARLVAIGSLGIPAVNLFGLEGISSLVALTYGVIFFWEAFLACRIVEASIREFLKTLSVPAFGSGVIVVGIYMALKSYVQEMTLGVLAMGMLVTIAIYLLFIFLVDKTTVGELRQLFVSKRPPSSSSI